jgi:hypothetical protein
VHSISHVYCADNFECVDRGVECVRLICCRDGVAEMIWIGFRLAFGLFAGWCAICIIGALFYGLVGADKGQRANGRQ